MYMRDTIRLSLHNLLLHKVRSFLTSLGIIFGVGSVISMLAISEGAKRESLAQIEAMGIDNIVLYTKKPPSEGEDESSESNISMIEAFGLTGTDLINIQKMDNIADVHTARDARKKILRGTKRLDLRLLGVSEGFIEALNLNLVRGRMLHPLDYDNAATVCVVGGNVKRKLFQLGATDIIGKTIRVELTVFRIVGVVEDRRGMQVANLNNLNDVIYIPMTTSRAVLGNTSLQREGRRASIQDVEHDIFLIKTEDVSYATDTAKRISRYMEKTHREVKDWDLFVPLNLFYQRERTQRIFTVVMSSIAGISLLVGGIGIMNIMLANVYERRREIGCRMALGARKKDILHQFLVEAVSLTVIGGLIGVLLGIAISVIITHYAQWPTVFTFWNIFVSLLISGIVGIVFGTYPAWKAARQDPIVVLRAE